MHEYLEDAQKGQPVDPERALSDGALKAAGLTPVKSWVRTRQSANALRAQRHKAKLAAQGVTQINVRAPEALHETLRTLAAEARAGRDWRAAVLPPETAALATALARGGWRARLLRFIARIAS